MDDPKNVSICCVVYDVSIPQSYRCRDSMTRSNQIVILVDDTKKSVELTLWGDLIHKLDNKEGTAIVLENVSPREFRGKRTITTTSETVIRLMGTDPSAEQLKMKGWWETTGSVADFTELLLEDSRPEA